MATSQLRQFMFSSIAVLAACSSESSTTGGGHPLLASLCDPSACDSPVPLAPNYLCDNNAIAGPACVAGANNECSWEILECPGVEECTPDECGDSPLGIPNWTCSDSGVIAGPACQRDDSGVCTWLIIDCPPSCVSPDPGGGGGTDPTEPDGTDPGGGSTGTDPTEPDKPIGTDPNEPDGTEPDGTDPGGTATGNEPGPDVVCPDDPTDPGFPPSCECPEPGPAAPNYLCGNGQEIAGPTCTVSAAGECGWQIVDCAEL